MEMEMEMEMAAAVGVSGRWTRVRTLGRGASGAEVYLAADEASGELFAVKAAAGEAGAAALRREQGVMAGLRSPHVVPCIGGGVGRDGSYRLFLEFAPGGSLADEAARSGGRLGEVAVARYAADVARGLAYLHGVGLVHGDVKARNVVIGADGRAKLADFGCAGWAGSTPRRPIGGTPAFMAPEVARGEEQGPAADVWALGCTVVEMATGRAPWSDMDAGDVLAAVRRIGYTEAVPEVPRWLSSEAKDFLARCFQRRPGDRSTAAQLLDHPFLAAAGSDVAKTEEPLKTKWVSPKSTLDAAFWDSDSDIDDDDELSQRTAERIRALACPASALPDWGSGEGWIDVISTPSDAPDATPMPPAEEAAASIDVVRLEASSSDTDLPDINDGSSSAHHNAGEEEEAVASLLEQERHPPLNSLPHETPCKPFCSSHNAMEELLILFTHGLVFSTIPLAIAEPPSSAQSLPFFTISIAERRVKNNRKFTAVTATYVGGEIENLARRGDAAAAKGAGERRHFYKEASSRVQSPVSKTPLCGCFHRWGCEERGGDMLGCQ